MYRCIGSGSGIELLRFSAGVSSSLYSNASPSIAAADKLRLEVKKNGSGVDWVIRKNGAVVSSGNDATALATANPGIGHSSTTTASATNFWEGGDLSSGYWPNLSAQGPGMSPGYAGMAGSARFTASNWWPYTTSVVSPDLTLALTGVSETSAVGTAGVQHTNATSDSHFCISTKHGGTRTRRTRPIPAISTFRAGTR